MAENKIAVMKAKDLQKVSARQRVVKVFSYTLLYLFLGIMALVVLFPFYWMIISSLKSIEEYMWTVPSFFPQNIQWFNYVKAFDTANL